jgi:hypothetical protein
MAVLPPPFPLPSADSDPYFAQLVASVTQAVIQSVTQSVTQAVTHSLKIYVDQHTQAQKFAVQAIQSTFEKKILAKIEDEQSLFLGEVQAQKQAISALCSSVDQVSTEVSKLAGQVSLPPP